MKESFSSSSDDNQPVVPRSKQYPFIAPVEQIIDWFIIGVIIVFIILLGWSMVRELVGMAGDLLSSDTKTAIKNGLFILILMEFVIILKYYLLTRHISLNLILGIGITSIIREVIFVFDTVVNWGTGIAFAVVLLALAVVYYVETHRRQLAEDCF